jgi:hypothetical protein
MIVFIIGMIIASIAILIVELRQFDEEMRAGYDRILKSIESTFDSVKTFFTVTLIDSISSAFSSDDSDDIDLDETNTDV